MNLHIQNPYPSGLALHLFAFAGQLIELFSVDLQGRIHGRDLVVVAKEAHDRLPDLLPGGCHRRFCQHPAGSILGVGGLSQQKHCPVGLLFFCQKSAELCGISQTDRKNSLRIRIESSRMAYLFLFYDSAELRHHVV